MNFIERDMSLGAKKPGSCGPGRVLPAPPTVAGALSRVGLGGVRWTARGAGCSQCGACTARTASGSLPTLFTAPFPSPTGQRSGPRVQRDSRAPGLWRLGSVMRSERPGAAARADVRRPAAGAVCTEPGEAALPSKGPGEESPWLSGAETCAERREDGFCPGSLSRGFGRVRGTRDMARQLVG